jgi:hypothetical protein
MKSMSRRGLILSLCAMGAVVIGAPFLISRGQQRKTGPTGNASAATASASAATLDKAAYDAKMLALANLPPRTGCTAGAAAASAKAAPTRVPRTAALRPAAFVSERAVPRPCPKALWPVHAVYPDAGALLPFKRIVTYYGNFYSPRMGILGEYPPDKVIAMLKSTAAAWAEADPSTPVVPALDYIVVAAQHVPGRDGMYRMRMPPGQIQKAISMANQIQGLLFLDVQPGWSTVEIEVPRLAEYLKLPNVELALDPEFALTESKRPGAWRGTMSASDINFAARFLAKLVQENKLPPKILIVHRFTQRMVTDFRDIKPLPEVEIVMDMDGFGSPALKFAAYRDFIARQPVQFTGFKLFYKNDVKWGGRLMTPAQVLRLSPQPIYILYQ